MTLRTAAALLALTAAGFAAPARAEPNCRVTLMGLTFDNGCPTRTFATYAAARSDALRQVHSATVDATTGSIVRHPVD